MAWRPHEYLIRGELDNTTLGKVIGWMEFVGLEGRVTFELEGDFHRDIRGAKIQFTGNASETKPPKEAAKYMADFVSHQTGTAGDITAGLEPMDYGPCPYIEWYSEQNGRIVLELDSRQVEVVGKPIPAQESEPVSRYQQNRNMARFLGRVARSLAVPDDRAACSTNETQDRDAKVAANSRVRGMKLLTKEIRKNLPPLYSQDNKCGTAMAHVKFFTPDSNWTWWATGGSPIKDEQGREVDFRFFGIVDGLARELGYFTLKELERIRGPLGLPIERDLHWKPKMLEGIAPELFKESEDKRQRGEDE